MAETIRVPASEILRKGAKEQREGVLFPINEYKPDSNEYSAAHPNAISNGDAKGKGDSGDGVVGSKHDIEQRIKLKTLNFYNSTNVYKSPE